MEQLDLMRPPLDVQSQLSRLRNNFRSRISPESKVEKGEKTVDRFLEDTWMHPLLDEETLNHRERGRSKVVKVFKDFSIEKDFLFLPIGSTIWIATDGSDHDGYLLYANNEALERVFGPLDDPNNKSFTKFLGRMEEENINLFTAVSLTSLSGYNHSELVSKYFLLNILITPDNMVVGDIAVAKKARLSIIEKISNSDNQDMYWDKIKGVYDKMILQWATNTDLFRAADKNEIRQRRIDQRIQAVAEDLGVNKLDLTNTVFNRPFPTFEEYKKVILESEGTLEIEI